MCVMCMACVYGSVHMVLLLFFFFCLSLLSNYIFSLLPPGLLFQGSEDHITGAPLCFS